MKADAPPKFPNVDAIPLGQHMQRYRMKSVVRYHGWIPETTKCFDDYIRITVLLGQPRRLTSWKVPPHVRLANMRTFDAQGNITMQPETGLKADPQEVESFVQRYGILRGEISPEDMRVEDSDLIAAGVYDDDEKWFAYFNTAEGRARLGQVPLIFREGFPKFGEAQRLLRAAWSADVIARAEISVQLGEFKLEPFDSEGIAVGTSSLWSFTCFLLMYDYRAGRIGICANPECPAPYFLKKRSTQKVCELGPCSEWAQRQYALKWWNKEGRKRRGKKSAKSRKQGRKRQ